MPITREQVLQALSNVVDAASGQDLVSADAVRALRIGEDGRVSFVLELRPEQAAGAEALRAAAVAAVEKIAGKGNVAAVATAEAPPARGTPRRAPEGPPPDLKIGRHPEPAAGPKPVPGVGRIIAVASGKGGVGKSTVAANLAAALAAEGHRTGLLDADIYGPSQARMLGVKDRPRSPDGKTILPLTAHGITMMSMGLLVPEDEAIIWRGPMLMGALQQMLGQVQWGELDYLIVDLPPGTGDVQLTLAQRTKVDGAVIVSTPQDIALIDARKAVDMFGKTSIPVLGIVENMAAFLCPSCGHAAHPFGHGGAKAEAARLGVPFLGEIPLDLKVREAGDAGVPVVVSHPGSAEAEAFRRLAMAVHQRMTASG